mgnify:CR=1 FL=1
MLTLRRALFLGGLLAAASLSTGAHAAQISGSQALGVASLTFTPSGPPIPALASITSFTSQQLVTDGPGSQTGDFLPLGALLLNASTLNTASLSTYTFGSTAFGTFAANYGIEVASPVNTRTFYFSGNFTVGNDPGYAAGLTGNTASFLLTLSQSGGAGNAISWSGTFNTPAIPLVPEPASMAMAAVPALLGLIALRKRAAK